VKIPLKNRLKQKQPSAHDVIQEELHTAYAIHPGHLMPSAIITALQEEGYRIVLHDEMESEIALAYQAGYDEGAESVGSAE